MKIDPFDRAGVLEVVREADKSWNAMTIGGTIMRIMSAYPELTLLDIDDMLREIGSRTTYLVAWPREAMPRELMAVDLANKPAPYALWVCINGLNDMLHQLHVFGLTIEQNREALKIAGFSTSVPI